MVGYDFDLFRLGSNAEFAGNLLQRDYKGGLRTANIEVMVRSLTW